MRTVAEHLSACLEVAHAAEPLDVVLSDAVGTVLAADIVSDVDMPPANLAGLDGYAVRAKDCVSASPATPVVLDVIDAVRAGDVRRTHLVPGTAVLIDSGAPMPIGTDAVVPWQFTDRGEAQVTINRKVNAGQRVRMLGEDVEAGATVLSKGSRIGARQVALLASLGHQRVAVHPVPRVVVVSIGDELIEPGQRAEPGDVYDANGHALSTAVADAGGQPFRVSAVPDEYHALTETLEDQLVRSDLLITTGGLSVGQGDTVKEVLSPLGTVRFDTVAMSPGRQLGVGTLGDGIPVFCLPGDPVSAQMAFEVFVRPVLRSIAGWQDIHRPSLPAAVSTSWSSPAGMREFVPVQLAGAPSTGYQAHPTQAPGVQTISGLAYANAIAVVPEEVTQVNAGTQLHCLLLDM